MGDRLPTPLAGLTNWLDRFGETSYDHQSYFAGPVGGRAKALYYRHPSFGALAVAPMIASRGVRPVCAAAVLEEAALSHRRRALRDGLRLPGAARRRSRHTIRRAVHFLRGARGDALRRLPALRLGLSVRLGHAQRRHDGADAAHHDHAYVYEAFAAVYRLDGDRRWQQVMQSIAEHAFADIKDCRSSDDAASLRLQPARHQAASSMPAPTGPSC